MTTRRFLPCLRGGLGVLLGLIALAGARLAAGAADADAPVGEGQPLVQYWSPRDYNGSGQCPCITQDARGIMYVGNPGKVMEYDGVTWRDIPTGDTGYIGSLAYDAGADTVFVGKEDDLGYLKTEPGGAHTYVSLRDRLPAGARDTGNFLAIHATPAGVFFVGSDQILRWRAGRFKAWKLATSNRPWSGWVAGHLYIASLRLGLQRLENEEFVSVSHDPTFHEQDVVAMFPGADGSLLFTTFDTGFYSLRDGVVEPLPLECDPFFHDKGVLGVLGLRDGSLAVATMTDGVVILDAKRHFRTRLDKTTGLHSSFVRQLREDAEGGLWLALETGVARVEVDSPLSIFRAGPDDEMSSAHASARWAGALAFGSANGIYRLAPADPATVTGPRLELLAGGINAATAMGTVANGLLNANGGRLQLLDHERQLTEVIPSTPVVTLMSSHVHPGRVYFVEPGGRLSKLRLDAPTGTWVNDGVVVELGVTGQFTLRESAGGDLWVGTLEHGLFRVQFEGVGAAKVARFFDQPGPLHRISWAIPASGQGPLVVITHGGLYRFDEASQTIEGLTAFGERFHDGSGGISEVVSHDANSLWLSFTNLHDPQEDRFAGRVVAGGPGRAPELQRLPHKIEEIIGKVQDFRPVEQPPETLKSVLLVGTTGNGIARLDVGRWEAQMRGTPRPFATLIRRAVTVHGEDADKELPILREPLPYARNTLHFEFAAGTLALGTAPRFQTRLAGFGEGEWSEWSDRASVDYLNLPEGSYVFEVRSRNADGQMGGVGTMAFRVLPPWQRSPWAYVLYALAAAVGVWGLVRWRGRWLRRRNVELETLVAARTGELRGREAELVRARDDAEAANRAKSAFLANMSHELRTPLNAVLGYAQLLLKQPDLAPRSRERISVIGQSGGHLLSLVNEVLDLSKVEAGKLTLAPYDFSLGQLLDETCAAFRPRLAEKKLTFTEHRAPGLPVTVHTDPSRLRQVLFNLLSNAVKFTQHGGVTLTVRPADEGRVRFEVTDTGVGIAPEEQRDIFVAFHQAGESRLASQGTGLGLAISQRLAGLLGGRIEVESTPGQGSRFWFELPLVHIEPVNGAAAQGRPEAALGKVTGYEGGTRRLLLVDDVGENRRVLCDFLLPLGFEIEEAADGAACLAACARQMPDAVLLDLRLGAMDGFEVARALRAREGAGRALAIIAISASVFESNRQHAIDAGCDDFLPKPFEETQLLGTLGRVLGLRWVQETAAASGASAGEPLAEGNATLPAPELELLRELSLRGDVAGIRRRLEAWRAEGVPDHADGVARQLESLVAAYDLEGIDDLLLKIHPHDSP